MSNPRLRINPEGLDPRVEAVLDGLIAPLQVWFDKGEIDFRGFATFVQPRCRYFLPTNQSLADDSDIDISWSALGQNHTDTDLAEVHFDNGALVGHKFLRADGKWLTPPIVGQYLVIVQVAFDGNATGRRSAILVQRSNAGDERNVAVASVLPVSTSFTYVQLSHVIDVVETGTAGVRVEVRQNSGGSLDLIAGYAATYIQMIKLS